MKQHYIKAVITLLETGQQPAEVVRGLKVVLEKRGHSRLLPSILQAVTRTLASKNPVDHATVTVADEHSYKRHQAAITDAMKTLGGADEATITVDPKIIGGFKVHTTSATLDQTYKTKLLELYRAITT